MINKDHDKTFCHITYDKFYGQNYQRLPGFHGDGFQGSKFPTKVTAEHSYIIATNPPTEFCLQPFFLKHLDEAKHNFFLELDSQAQECNVYKSLSNHLYLIDPYMVHRTPFLADMIDRKFVRITYTFTELENPHNTINSMFDNQSYENRVDIRTTLCTNEFPVPYHLYGLERKNYVSS